ncbi:MAG: hypothetical protein OEQ15_03975 [Nitrosopumilus sp.]|nr:hypothetical protein [Nitrosopumilus sp.]
MTLSVRISKKDGMIEELPFMKSKESKKIRVFNYGNSSCPLLNPENFLYS